MKFKIDQKEKQILINFIKFIPRKIKKNFLRIKWYFFDFTIKNDYEYNLHIDNNSRVEFDLSIPETAKKVRIDVGLSYHAPQSAAWLELNNDLYVIGIEANKYNVARINKYGLWYLKNNLIYKRKINQNFKLLYCAIANVKKPTHLDFYNMHGDSGTSSLLKPTNKLLKTYNYKIHKITKVPAIPLSTIIEKIPKDKFSLIELVKIDTQGSDLEVIKSINGHLDRIVCIQVETSTFGQYENAGSSNSIINYLESNNFYEIKILNWFEGEPVDVIFANKKFDKLANILSLEIQESLY